ncbi:uncharacterized protein LOC108669121 [Hyalella azteca]|uniref:Uncharacterized protein LOC108669121 n=1 Tax=Hyalella azteca TaxID=294128 RepID=A0A8B7NE64_HYAAZ|nr:uncharacterized protein LOC108669121 [Hyalella azteca]
MIELFSAPCFCFLFFFVHVSSPLATPILSSTLAPIYHANHSPEISSSPQTFSLHTFIPNFISTHQTPSFYSSFPPSNLSNLISLSYSSFSSSLPSVRPISSQSFSINAYTPSSLSSSLGSSRSWLSLSSVLPKESSGTSILPLHASSPSRLPARGSSPPLESQDFSLSRKSWDSSTPELRGSSTPESWDSSTPELRDSSTPESWDSSTPELRGSSAPESWDSSSPRESWDSSTPGSWDSSTPGSWGSSTPGTISSSSSGRAQGSSSHKSSQGSSPPRESQSSSVSPLEEGLQEVAYQSVPLHASTALQSSLRTEEDHNQLDDALWDLLSSPKSVPTSSPTPSLTEPNRTISVFGGPPNQPSVEPKALNTTSTTSNAGTSSKIQVHMNPSATITIYNSVNTDAIKPLQEHFNVKNFEPKEMKLDHKIVEVAYQNNLNDDKLKSSIHFMEHPINREISSVILDSGDASSVDSSTGMSVDESYGTQAEDAATRLTGVEYAEDTSQISATENLTDAATASDRLQMHEPTSQEWLKDDNSKDNNKIDTNNDIPTTTITIIDDINTNTSSTNTTVDNIALIDAFNTSDYSTPNAVENNSFDLLEQYTNFDIVEKQSTLEHNANFSLLNKSTTYSKQQSDILEELGNDKNSTSASKDILDLSQPAIKVETQFNINNKKDLMQSKLLEKEQSTGNDTPTKHFSFQGEHNSSASSESQKKRSLFTDYKNITNFFFHDHFSHQLEDLETSHSEVQHRYHQSSGKTKNQELYKIYHPHQATLPDLHNPLLGYRVARNHKNEPVLIPPEYLSPDANFATPSTTNAVHHTIADPRPIQTVRYAGTPDSAQIPSSRKTFSPSGFKVPKYNFSYRVDHETSGNHFGHDEEREGSKTSGQYSVILPDGRTQVVTYHADTKGYRANVQYKHLGHDISVPGNRRDPVIRNQLAISHTPANENQESISRFLPANQPNKLLHSDNNFHEQHKLPMIRVNIPYLPVITPPSTRIPADNDFRDQKYGSSSNQNTPLTNGPLSPRQNINGRKSVHRRPQHEESQESIFNVEVESTSPLIFHPTLLQVSGRQFIRDLLNKGIGETNLKNNESPQIQGAKSSTKSSALSFKPRENGRKFNKSDYFIPASKESLIVKRHPDTLDVELPKGSNGTGFVQDQEANARLQVERLPNITDNFVVSSQETDDFPTNGLSLFVKASQGPQLLSEKGNKMSHVFTRH